MEGTQIPTNIPTTPSFPCFGAILARRDSAFSFALSFLDRKNLFEGYQNDTVEIYKMRVT